MTEYNRLVEIACQEFPDIVVQAETRPEKLRVHLIDGSYVDAWLSRRLPDSLSTTGKGAILTARFRGMTIGHITNSVIWKVARSIFIMGSP